MKPNEFITLQHGESLFLPNRIVRQEMERQKEIEIEQLRHAQAQEDERRRKIPKEASTTQHPSHAHAPFASIASPLHHSNRALQPLSFTTAPASPSLTKHYHDLIAASGSPGSPEEDRLSVPDLYRERLRNSDVSSVSSPRPSSPHPSHRQPKAIQSTAPHRPQLHLNHEIQYPQQLVFSLPQRSSPWLSISTSSTAVRCVSSTQTQSPRVSLSVSPAHSADFLVVAADVLPVSAPAISFPSIPLPPPASSSSSSSVITNSMCLSIPLPVSASACSGSGSTLLAPPDQTAVTQRRNGNNVISSPLFFDTFGSSYSAYPSS